jgi:hypothetical protein
MFSITHDQLSKIAVAGAFVAVTSLSVPAIADELAQNLGPVGPHEPILTSVGSKRVIAFYLPGSDYCALQAVVFDKTDAYTGMTTAARVRISLEPGQIVHIDSTDNESLNLQCGKNAEKLTIVDTDSSSVASGSTIQSPAQSIKANVSGF